MKMFNIYKFALIPFLFFPRNPKQESRNNAVGCLVTSHVSAFCLKKIAVYLLQNHAEFNGLLYRHFFTC